MRRWKIMAVLLTIVLILPTQAKELGELIPVAVMNVRIEDNEIVVETDTGEEGRGETFEKAIKEMERLAPGYLLYDTVENLILEKGCEYLLPQLRDLLRPSTRVLITSNEIKMEGIQEYLKVHQPASKLSEDFSGSRNE